MALILGCIMPKWSFIIEMIFDVQDKHLSSLITEPVNKYCLRIELAHCLNLIPRNDFTRYPTDIMTFNE